MTATCCFYVNTFTCNSFSVSVLWIFRFNPSICKSSSSSFYLFSIFLYLISFSPLIVLVGISRIPFSNSGNSRDLCLALTLMGRLYEYSPVKHAGDLWDETNTFYHTQCRSSHFWEVWKMKYGCWVIPVLSRHQQRASYDCVLI